MLGLRDRVRGLLGRERSSGPRAPGAEPTAARARGGAEAPASGPRLASLARPSVGPAAVPAVPAGARLLTVCDDLSGGVALSSGADVIGFSGLGALARALPAGAPVVLRADDPALAAAAAERLNALGVPVSWLSPEAA